MMLSRFSRRIVNLIALGVAVPALLLAGLAIYLTLLIARAVEDDSIRYNSYLAQQVAEAFEQELGAQLRVAIVLAENAARNDAPAAQILDALAAGTREFRGPHFVPLE